jgi:hypothetical protein
MSGFVRTTTALSLLALYRAAGRPPPGEAAAGHPHVIAQNMLGAGGCQAAN